MKLSFTKNKFVLRAVNGDLPDFNFDSKYWRASNTHHYWTTSNLKEAARFKTHADESAKRIFKKFALKRYALPPGGFHDVDNPSFAVKLLPFQRELGVPFILKQNRSYLAHEQGLGKSVQFITAVSVKPGPALIICPGFLKTNWAREITSKFIYDFPFIQVIPETARSHEVDWGADFIICPDSMLSKPWVIDGISKTKFRFIAIDEIHRFKSFDSNRSIALFGGRKKALLSPGLIYNAEHVVGLSGTPMLNRPIELWSVLYAMAPETIDFMAYHEFGFKFCGPTQNDRGQFMFLGSHNEAELKSRIMPAFMQRIVKTEVLPDLPDKVREVVYVEDKRDPRLLPLDEKLRDELGTFEKPKSLGEWANLRHINGVEKGKWAAGFIREIMYEDQTESVIVYAYHRDVVSDLCGFLADFEPMYIMGGVSEAARVTIEDAFQRGERRLLIGNIKAMGVGLNLTKATRVVFVEYSETPAENEQAEDRAHRIGQHDSVFCQYLAIANSIDEAYLQMILRKQETIKKVIGA